MDKQLVKLWLEEPITQVFIDLLKEHREANVQAILNIQWEQESIGRLNQIKGQVNTLDLILDFESFFSEKLEDNQKVDEDGEEA